MLEQPLEISYAPVEVLADDPLVTVREVAVWLRTIERRVLKLHYDGALQGFRLPGKRGILFRRSRVEALLKTA